MSKKKILIHSIVFSPDGVSTAYLYNDIALHFANYEYEVVVLTTTPHYNIVKEALIKQPLNAKWGGLYFESTFNNIRVIHVPQQKFKSTFLRIVGFFYWHIISLILGLLQKNISVILSPSPPLTIGLINIIISKFRGAKVIYNVQEIYPDFLINQGVLKSGIAIKVLKWLEKFVYNKSDAVITIDEVFYKTIVPRFKQPQKLHIIPNFVDTSLFKPIKQAQSKLDSNYFPQKREVLKVMYAGNIGYAQDWGSLIEVAKMLKTYLVEFIVIGEGIMKVYLQEQIKLNELENIRVMPYQPRDNMPQLIAYADLHFIFMTKEMEGQGFPSKVYTIMACAKPLLIVSGPNTPIRNFLEPLNCAFIAGTADFNKTCIELVGFIKEAMASPNLLIAMGNNGYGLIEKKYSKSAVTSQYVHLVDKLLINE